MQAVSGASAVEMKGLRALFHVLARFAKYLRPLWHRVLLRVILTQCTAFLGVFGIIVTIKVMDYAFPRRSVSALFLWLGFEFLLGATSSFLGLLNGATGVYVGLRLEMKFKDMFLRHVQRLSLRFFDTRPVGEHMYRIQSDTGAAVALVNNFIPVLVERLQRIVTTLGLLLVLNRYVIYALTAYIALYILWAHIMGSFSRTAAQRERVRSQEVDALLQERLAAFSVMRLFGRERYELLQYQARLVRRLEAWVLFGAYRSLWTVGAMVSEGSFYALGHWLLCGTLVFSGKLTIGEFVGVGMVINQLQMPLQELAQTIQEMRINAVPAERMLDTLEVQPEIQDSPTAVKLVSPQGRIAFEHVFFRYTPDGPDVIQDLSFEVQPGTKLALVGTSGAGKTSVFNLAMRYYDPTRGRVLVDGTDLRDLDLKSYRDHVGLVLQDNFLFSATIRDNILFGKLDATSAEFDEAVLRSGVGQFVDGLPEGYNTVLAEGGNVSAGQRQRLAIARAVIRNPKFLYLDEATSALDPVTEREILAQLRQIESGRTRIVISHNISSVQDADEILVLEKGVLVQRGNHAQLSTQEGSYLRMWTAELEKAERTAPKATA